MGKGRKKRGIDLGPLDARCFCGVEICCRLPEYKDVPLEINPGTLEDASNDEKCITTTKATTATTTTATTPTTTKTTATTTTITKTKTTTTTTKPKPKPTTVKTTTGQVEDPKIWEWGGTRVIDSQSTVKPTTNTTSIAKPKKTGKLSNNLSFSFSLIKEWKLHFLCIDSNEKTKQGRGIHGKTQFFFEIL